MHILKSIYMENPSVFILFSDEEFKDKTIPLISASGYGYAGSGPAGADRIVIDTAEKPMVVLYQTPRFTKKGFSKVRQVIGAKPGTDIIVAVDEIGIKSMTVAFHEGVRGIIDRAAIAGGLHACLQRISEGGIFIDQKFTEVFVDLIKMLPADEDLQHR